MAHKDPTAHFGSVGDTTSSPESPMGALGAESHCPADEVVLRLGSGDKLIVAWGGIVSQKAGQQRGTNFGHDPSYWLVLVNLGTLHLTVDGKPIDLSQGHTLLVLPHEDCKGIGRDESAAQWQWLAFRVNRSRRRTGRPDVEVPRVSRVDEPERMSDMFRLIAEEFTSTSPINRMIRFCPRPRSIT